MSTVDFTRQLQMRNRSAERIGQNEGSLVEQHGVARLDLGITREAFDSEYFEKNVLLVRRALRSHFAWADVDQLLYFTDPSPPYFKLFKGGEVPAEAFATATQNGLRLDKAKFYEYLHSGATVVMNRLERDSLIAHRLCHDVARFCGHTTIGNGYLTFGGTGTFGKHWDTHDVFAIQLLGKKRWRIYQPSWPLPLSHHSSEGQQAHCPAQPVLDIELNVGDALYIPRGWWHETIPCDGGSFHLSVGAYAPTVLEFAQWSCRQLEAELSARSGLSATSSSIDDETIETLVAKIRGTLSDPGQLQAFLRSGDRLPGNGAEAGEFDLHSLAHPTEALPDSTLISLQGRHPPQFEGHYLVRGDSMLRLEPLRKAVVHALIEQPLEMSALCGLVAAPRAAIQAAVLDLAQHDVVGVRRPHM